MAVKRAAVAVFGHECSDRAQIVAELLGRNGGVFPAFPAVGLAGDKDHGAESGLAHMPDGGGFFRRADVGDGRGGPGLRGAGNGLGLGLRLFGRPCAHFDQQKADAGRELVEILEREALAAHEIDKQVIKSFETDGLVFEGQRNGVGGEKGSSKPSTVSTRKGGLAVRLSVAETMLAQVPSVPTSARATWKPFSGSSSSRL